MARPTKVSLRCSLNIALYEGPDLLTILASASVDQGHTEAARQLAARLAARLRRDVERGHKALDKAAKRKAKARPAKPRRAERPARSHKVAG